MLISLSTNAQDRLLDYNKEISFSVGYNSNGGITALRDNNVIGVPSIYASVQIYGFYIGLSYNSGDDHSRNLGIEKYSGYRTRAYHFGYAIPICRWFKVIPIIGYSTWESGYWDGSDWAVDSEGVYNKFYADYSHKAFDYGVSLHFTIAKFINLYTNVTANNISLGAGLTLPLRKP